MHIFRKYKEFKNICKRSVKKSKRSVPIFYFGFWSYLGKFNFFAQKWAWHEPIRLRTKKGLVTGTSLWIKCYLQAKFSIKIRVTP